MMTYGDIIKDETLARTVLEECCFTADYPAKEWEIERRFISTAIDKSGTFLDIGCANGFLIKSLQFWSGKDLIPYGIDFIDENIVNAKKLFPDHEENFITYSYEVFIKSYPKQFPDKFDYIYWAPWNNWGGITKTDVDILLSHITSDGKLIIGFYPSDSREPSDSVGNISRLISSGHKVQNIGNDAFGRNEHIIIISMP